MGAQTQPIGWAALPALNMSGLDRMGLFQAYTILLTHPL